jgi:hypothetical protein
MTLSRSSRPYILLSLVVALTWPAASAAQGVSRAGLRGTITDADGAPQPQAEVVVTHDETGFRTATLSNRDGRYLLTGLNAGDGYRVRVELLGFATVERTEVSLRAGEVRVLDFELTTEAIALDDITVRAEAEDPRFSRSHTGRTTILGEEAIRGHPTVERNVLQMAEISPVVSRTDDGGLSISGQNARYNAVLIDGALHQDVFGAHAGGIPGGEARARALPMDAVQDFQIEVAPFDVRSSGFTGGILNAVTRRGTNAWHGSLTAEFRDEQFFGPLNVDGTDLAPDNYRKHVVGGTLSGPLIQDRLHIFMAAELDDRSEPPLGYSLGPGNPLHTRVAPDSADRVAGILEERYGLEAGESGRYALDNVSGNVFARIDWQINPRHTFSSHLNLVRATRDVSANRTPLGAYEFSSSGYDLESTTIGLKAQLNSQLSQNWHNELMVSVQRTRDARDPVGRFPQVDVNVLSQFDDYLLRRTVRAGANYMAQRSDLDQDVFQLTDALSWARGDLTTTFGAGLDVFHFRHDFLPGALGYYRFESLQHLEENNPSHYEINLMRPGVTDEAVSFTVAQPSALIQNEHRFPDGLIVYYGIRAEMPLFLGSPEYNPAIDAAFDRRTDELPSGALLISPRLGVNWQSDLQYTTQVRGGGGVFTGRLPYIWLANAYANTGLRSMVFACRDYDIPAMDPTSPPMACADGATPMETGTANALVFRPDFRYPRELKASLAIDQQLPLGLTASAEVLLVQTMSQVIIQDLNLVSAAPKDTDYNKMFGPRTQFGEPVAPTGYYQRHLLDGYAHVLEMGNENSSGFAHAITLGLERGFGDRFAMSGSYSFNHSDDVQSLQSGDALINYASNATGRNPNQLGRRPSAFNRPWKAVGTMRARMPERWTGGTELSLVYIAEAGSAYSYVYADDINGDGYSGPGIQQDASNDLFYVPTRTSDLRAPFATLILLEQLINLEPCLRDIRGQILKRNACRSPDSHRVDLKLVQPITLGRYRVEMMGSLLNVLNLMDNEWGRSIHVPPLVPIVALGTRETRPIGVIIPDSRPSLHYVGPVMRDPDENRARAALPHTVIVPESQWQAQIGLKLSF